MKYTKAGTKLAERMEEEVLDKYKVVERNKVAFRGGGAPLEWRMVSKSKEFRIRKWVEDCSERISPCLENTTCSVCNVTRRSQRKKKSEAAARNGYHDRSDKENKIRRKSGC